MPDTQELQRAIAAVRARFHAGELSAEQADREIKALQEQFRILDEGRTPQTPMGEIEVRSGGQVFMEEPPLEPEPELIPERMITTRSLTPEEQEQARMEERRIAAQSIRDLGPGEPSPTARPLVQERTAGGRTIPAVGVPPVTMPRAEVVDTSREREQFVNQQVRATQQVLNEQLNAGVISHTDYRDRLQVARQNAEDAWEGLRTRTTGTAKEVEEARARGELERLVQTGALTPGELNRAEVDGASVVLNEYRQRAGLPVAPSATPAAGEAGAGAAVEGTVEAPAGAITGTRARAGQRTGAITGGVPTAEGGEGTSATISSTQLSTGPLPEEVQDNILDRVLQTVDEESLLRYLAGRQQSDFIRTQADDLLRRREEEAAQRRAESAELGRRLQDFQNRLNVLKNQRLDPTRLFQDRGLGFSMALGIGVGALQQTMSNILYPGTNATNTALGLINDAIERDIAAQEFNLRRGESLLGMDMTAIQMARQLTDDDQAAREYAIAAAQAHSADVLDAMARRSAPGIQRQELLRAALLQRQEAEQKMLEFEHRVTMDNARTAAQMLSARGRGAGGGGRRPSAAELREQREAEARDRRRGRGLGSPNVSLGPDALDEDDVFPTAETKQQFLDSARLSAAAMSNMRRALELLDAPGVSIPGSANRQALSSIMHTAHDNVRRALEISGTMAGMEMVEEMLPTLRAGAWNEAQVRAGLEEMLRAVNNEFMHWVETANADGKERLTYRPHTLPLRVERNEGSGGREARRANENMARGRELRLARERRNNPTTVLDEEDNEENTSEGNE